MNTYRVTFLPLTDKDLLFYTDVEADNETEAVFRAYDKNPVFIGQKIEVEIVSADPELERLLAEEEKIQNKYIVQKSVELGKLLDKEVEMIRANAIPQPDPAKVCFNRMLKKYAADKLLVALDNYTNGFCTLDEYVETVSQIRQDAIYYAMYEG